MTLPRRKTIFHTNEHHPDNSVYITTLISIQWHNIAITSHLKIYMNIFSSSLLPTTEITQIILSRIEHYQHTIFGLSALITPTSPKLSESLFFRVFDENGTIMFTRKVWIAARKNEKSFID